MKSKQSKINREFIPDDVFSVAWKLLGDEKTICKTLRNTSDEMLRKAISSICYGNDWEKHFNESQIEHDLLLFKRRYL